MASNSLYPNQNITLNVITEAVALHTFRVVTALRNELLGKEVMDVDKGL